MRLLRHLILVLVLLPALGAASASGEAVDVAAATYEPYSVTPPTPEGITICHGFGCKYRTEIALGPADRAALAKIMAAGRNSGEAERKAIAVAGAWFDRRIGSAAGTVNHIRHAGYTHMYEPNQFDCIDSSRNTTTLLLVLEKMKLLRHHTVEVPVSRGLLFDGRPPHTTAVLVESKNGEGWAVDSWTVGYGEAPEIIRLSVWKTLE